MSRFFRSCIAALKDNPMMEGERDPEFFRKILLQCNFPILITDPRLPDNPIVFVNEAFERVTGYRISEALGQNCRFLQNNDRQQPGVKEMANAISRNGECEVVVRNYRRNGEMFWNKLYVFPLYNRDGDVISFVGIQHDVTNDYVISARLKEVRGALENSIDAFLRLDRSGKIIEANRAVEPIFGWRPDELVNDSVYRLIPPERLAAVRDNLQDQLQQQSPQLVCGEYLRKDGSKAIIEWVIIASPARNSLVLIGRDITDKVRAEAEASQAREKLAMIFDSIAEGCFSLDRQWNCTYINAQGAARLASRPQDLLGKNLWDEFPDVAGTPFHDTYLKAMESRTFAHCEAFYPPLHTWFEVRAYPSPEGITVFFLDISERKSSEEKLIRAATHDSLTGLLNRSSCLDRLDEVLQDARDQHLQVGVLFIDLDRFKEVNDAFGHRAGDEVLKNLGSRFEALADDRRLPARMGGDEFLFVVTNTSKDELTDFAASLIQIVRQPLEIFGYEVSVGASIGIALIDNEMPTVDELISQADTAMYAAKTSGRYTFAFYTKEVQSAHQQRFQLRKELPPALKNGEFTLFYQPQCTNDGADVIGAEALIRWRHPVYGLLAPDTFLPLAEESSFILDLGMWVFVEACRQCAAWQCEGHALIISVNVSARQLSDRMLPAALKETVQAYGIDPSRIKLELTESMLAQDFQVAADVLSQLKEYGFCIALDDFGTGYSNLSYINRFPITAIKIDRSFVKDLGVDPSALDLVHGIVALAKSLGLIVIVEGVETEAQRQVIMTTKSDAIQGYLVGRPVSAQEFAERYLRHPIRA